MFMQQYINLFYEICVYRCNFVQLAQSINIQYSIYIYMTNILCYYRRHFCHQDFSKFFILPKNSLLANFYEISHNKVHEESESELGRKGKGERREREDSLLFKLSIEVLTPRQKLPQIYTHDYGYQGKLWVEHKKFQQFQRAPLTLWTIPR